MSYRAQLKKAAGRKTDTVDAGGVTVHLMEMSGLMRDYYNADSTKRCKTKGKGKNIVPDLSTLNLDGQRALLLAMCIVDEGGAHPYDYRNKDDIDEINGFGSGFVEPVHDVASELCGLTQEAEDDAEKKPGSAEVSVSG